MTLDDMHAAAKIIETDGFEGYQTCTRKYGPQVAQLLLVAWLRSTYNPERRWPEPEDLKDRVNRALADQHVQVNGLAAHPMEFHRHWVANWGPLMTQLAELAAKGHTVVSVQRLSTSSVSGEIGYGYEVISRTGG